MIAKYAGKCDLTFAAIVPGVTEIAKFGNATVLAEYATKEAVDAWFAAKVAERIAIFAEMSEITGRDYSAKIEEFESRLHFHRTDKFSVFKDAAVFVDDEIAQARRILDRKRQQA